MAESNLPPCLIFIDKEGRWFHKGAEMVHREFIQLFYEHMERDASGRYIISMGGDRCYLEVEDTPFVIRQVRFHEGAEGESPSRCMLSLSDDTREILRPDTLFIGAENVLYAKVKEGAFPARFLRPAYYQLAQHIVEEDGSYVLPLEDKKYVIQTRGT
jgi:hypothetical protein